MVNRSALPSVGRSLEFKEADTAMILKRDLVRKTQGNLRRAKIDEMGKTSRLL